MLKPSLAGQERWTARRCNLSAELEVAAGSLDTYKWETR